MNADYQIIPPAPTGRGAVVIDGDIVEVLCTPTAVQVTEFEEPNGRVRHEFALHVTDVAGEARTFTTRQKAHAWKLLRMAGRNDPGQLQSFIDGVKWRREVMKEYATRDPIVVRADAKTGEIFGLMSQQWRPINIEALVDDVRDVFGDQFDSASASLRPSDGRNGGALTLELDPMGDDLYRPRLEVDCGPKDGDHSIRIDLAARILACSNMLTVEVRAALKGLVDTSLKFALATQHRGAFVAAPGWIKNRLADIRGAQGSILGLAAAAKSAPLALPEARQVMDYYARTGSIARENASTILSLFMEPKIAQYPESLYGLVMATTWFATHHLDVPPPVVRRARTTAGEMLVVSPKFERYMDVVAREVAPAAPIASVA